MSGPHPPDASGAAWTLLDIDRTLRTRRCPKHWSASGACVRCSLACRHSAPDAPVPQRGCVRWLTLATGHAPDASGASCTSVRCTQNPSNNSENSLNPAEQAQQEGEGLSTSFSTFFTTELPPFVNMPTPPSVHHHVHVC